MDFNQLVQIFNSNQAIFNFFYRAVAIVGGFIFLIYAIVVRRQVVVMTRTVQEEPINGILMVLGIVQIFVALLLILLSFAIM